MIENYKELKFYNVNILRYNLQKNIRIKNVSRETLKTYLSH